MSYLKSSTIFLMLIGLISQNIFANALDKQGKTKFMEYVEQREKELVSLTETVEKLWHICIDPKVTITETIDTHTTTYHIRSDCHPSSLLALYNGRKNLQNFQRDTEKQIAKILKEGALIDAADDEGKTALSYVQSRVVYNALRNQGASFQLDAFAHINQYQLMVTALVAAVWSFFLADLADKKLNQVSNTNRNRKKSSYFEEWLHENEDYLKPLAVISTIILLGVIASSGFKNNVPGLAIFDDFFEKNYR